MIGGSRKRRHHSKPDPRLDPTRPPDRNPDELVWKHLKADTVGRMTITDKADFHTKVRASMRQLQSDPEENPFLLPKAIPQIRRMKVNRLMD
jgi:hypothetical protein